ncbi:hypothetical protein P3X46_031763 [Hevea brasiliensis]|uniref:DUF676 domain-containing protein n=1 Tax=Hevea brasiliensis TaxID=3981 RepID=A0ABQ9KPI7_HEVBR|nr:uncharacterized protein LOC110649782 [Hevea brasiliensis]KAJ9141195.1 hypothetical protein P3X46_031763 [Hevea brasiliensis]
MTNDSLPRMIAATSLLLSPKQIAVFNSGHHYSGSLFCSIPLGFVSNLGFGGERALSTVGGPRMMGYLRRIGGGWFKGGNGKALKIEADGGGEDVFYAAAAKARDPPDHIVIMINGIVGSSADWKYAAEQFVKKLPDKVIVHRSECNYSKLTFDGVDLMGERLAKEVLAVVKHKPELRKISFVAHSLGGLVARYAIARLYENLPKLGLSSLSVNSLSQEHMNSVQCPEQLYEARIAGLEPTNFITFATPHLGSRGNKQLPFLCGLHFLERRASQTAHLIVGRTGKHLFLTDNDGGKPPLLLQMVNDSDDLRFISALRAFKRRVAYANANYDHMVGWRTSSIRRQQELPKPNLLVTNQKYPHIVYVEQETMSNCRNKESTAIRDQTTDLEEEMIKGLTQVPWERVDVSFHKSRQRYIAHSTIQVKTYWLNSDGADVVFHMIDNFLL